MRDRIEISLAAGLIGAGAVWIGYGVWLSFVQQKPWLASLIVFVAAAGGTWIVEWATSREP